MDSRNSMMSLANCSYQHRIFVSMNKATVSSKISEVSVQTDNHRNRNFAIRQYSKNPNKITTIFLVRLAKFLILWSFNRTFCPNCKWGEGYFTKKCKKGPKITSTFDPPEIGGYLLVLIRNVLKY